MIDAETLRLLLQAQAALDEYAESPTTPGMDNYTCHRGLCPKEKCSRCGRAIGAFNASKAITEYIKTRS